MASRNSSAKARWSAKCGGITMFQLLGKAVWAKVAAICWTNSSWPLNPIFTFAEFLYLRPMVFNNYRRLFSQYRGGDGDADANPCLRPVNLDRLGGVQHGEAVEEFPRLG